MCVQVSYGLVVAVSLICSTVAVLSIFCYSLCYCFVMVSSYVDPIIVMSHGISYPKPTKRERKTFVFHWLSKMAFEKRSLLAQPHTKTVGEEDYISFVSWRWLVGAMAEGICFKCSCLSDVNQVWMSMHVILAFFLPDQSECLVHATQQAFCSSLPNDLSVPHRPVPWWCQLIACISWRVNFWWWIL